MAFAFLFGSQAKGCARAASDWDVGAALLEERREREQEIWKAVESITETDVDLVILNRAAAPFLWNILRAGQPLAINDRRALLDTMFRASDEANAWHETSRRYYRMRLGHISAPSILHHHPFGMVHWSVRTFEGVISMSSTP